MPTEHPTNRWLYPWDGPRLGVQRHHNPKQDGVLVGDALDRIREHSRAQLSAALVRLGYGPPSGAALDHLDETIHHDVFSGDTEEEVRRETVLRFEFPTGPKEGEQIALVDAFWNRRLVTPKGPVTSVVVGALHGFRPRPLPLFLDLATGQWCAFDHDTSLRGPLGPTYTLDSPATHYPQPGDPQ